MDGVLSLNIPREKTNEIVRKERNVQGTLPKTIELEALEEAEMMIPLKNKIEKNMRKCLA